MKLLVVKIVDQVNINQYRTHSNIGDGCFGENRQKLKVTSCSWDFLRRKGGGGRRGGEGVDKFIK